MTKKADFDAKKQAKAGVGNTIEPPLPEEKTNKKNKKGKSSRNWCFTFNNHEKEDIDFLLGHWSEQRYVFQEECGESGTPHLQGVVVFKNSKFMHQLRKYSQKIHWESCKSIIASIEYCSKKTKRWGGIWVKGYKVKDMTFRKKKRPLLHKWQKDLLEILDDKEDDYRSINWWWEEYGNVGKTYFIKWLMTYRKCCYIGGKANDAKYILRNFIDKNGEPDIIAFNIPRRYMEKLNYELIEQVKDMLLVSGKYESCSLMSWKNPHVLVFANEEPQLKALSLDRWKVVKIVLEEL